MVDASQIMAYEAGELTVDDTVAMFAEMVKDGSAWTLQGHYGRTAADMIEGGYISREGEVIRLPGDEV